MISWLAITGLNRGVLAEVKRQLSQNFKLFDVESYCSGLIKNLGSDEIPYSIVYQLEKELYSFSPEEQVLICDWLLVPTWEFWVQLPVNFNLVVTLAEPDGVSPNLYFGLGKVLNSLRPRCLICFQRLTDVDLKEFGYKVGKFGVSFETVKSRELVSYFQRLNLKLKSGV